MSEHEIPEHVKPYLNDRYYYCVKSAAKPIAFIQNFLYFFDGLHAGERFKLLPWQIELIQKTYGIRRKENGLKRFKTVFILLPRKSAKSTTVAALLLYELVCGDQLYAQNFLAANARKQASYLLDIMKGLVAASPQLRRIVEIQKNKLLNKKTKSFIETVSREGTTVYGSSPKTFVYDEITFSPSEDLFQSLSTGQGAQKEPLSFLIGTASPSKVNWGYSMFEYAEKIYNNPELNESFLSIIYRLPEDLDWKDENNWYIANPSLGESVTIDNLRDEFQKTKDFPSYESSFRLFYLNQFVADGDSWIPDSTWKENADDSIDITDFAGEQCWLGLDLANVDDLASLVAVFYKDEKFYVFPFIFVPNESLEKKAKRHKVDYLSWEKRGYITPTYGNNGLVVDYQALVDKISELRDNFDVQALYLDPWNSTAFVNLIEADHMDIVVMVRQGFKTMSPLIKESEKIIISNRMVHPDNPVLNWCIGNSVIEMDPAGNVKISKKKSTGKVDATISMVMALGGAAADLAEGEYDTSILFLD